ncbi:MAG: DUF2157 domain-containing protein [Acidobacteria bacterium]|nr:DUF2157 domain-containing protein [Acidobacteriota bacterium]
MRQLSVKWLLRELPKLEAGGVVDAAAAERLRAHYTDTSETGRQLMVAIFAVFGAVLIGGGVILLLAHNWESFGRGTRAAIALSPLVATQVLVGWMIVKRFGSTAWREGSATLLALTVAEAIALVDQTYHTGGDLASFLWRWALLLAPLPWLLDSTAVAVIFLAALTCWAGAAKAEGSQILVIWPLAAAVVPHLIQVLRSDRRGLRAANLQWAIALFVCVAAGLGLEHRVPGLWILIYVGLFALLITLGTAFRRDEESLWRRPFEVVGVAGSVILWTILSFEEPWKNIGWQHIITAEQLNEIASWVDVLLAVGLPTAAMVAIAFIIDRQRDRLVLLWVISVPLVAVVWPVTAATDIDWLGALAFNLLLFVVGVATLSEGVRGQNLAVVNLGMAVVALLIIVRFFDSDLGFIFKGLAFIFVGIGFLVANMLLSRRNRAVGGSGP